jgi:membrane-associated phospholipid phosphatase
VVLRGLFRRVGWQAQDIAFFGYLGIVLCLLLVFGVGFRHIDDAWVLVGSHLLIGGLGAAALVLPLAWDRPVANLLRWWYPFVLCVFCFWCVGRMIHLIQPELIDARLVLADERLFGTVLTPIMQQRATPMLTELMYFSYFSYYFLVPALGLPLYLRGGGGYEPFREFMLAVTLTFWVSYLHFLFTPAGGPVFWPAYPGPVLTLSGGPITALAQWVFDAGTIVGGAFPSSHVAVAFVVAIYAWRFGVAPFVFAPLFVGLSLSTVYTGHHYGVDVLYGTMIGAAVAAGVGLASAARQPRSETVAERSPANVCAPRRIGT